MSLDGQNSCFADVVSVLFYKKTQPNRYLLVNSNDLYSLPCSKTIEDNWDKTAQFVMNRVFDEKDISKELFKIRKIWVPQCPKEHAFHIIFSVQISERNQLNNELNFRWLTFDDLKELRTRGQLWSPEIVTFVMMKETLSSRNESSRPVSDKTLEMFTNNSLLSETSESDILICNADVVSLEYFELLTNSEIQLSDQRCLYNHFLRYCFPYLYMNLKCFANILIEKMSWESDDCISLFRSADLSNRGALSFRDFMLIFAACSKTTPHTGRPAEIRSKYIFRFFDENADGLMYYEDYLKLIKYIRKAKKQKTDNGSVDEEATKYALDIGITPEIAMTLLQFVSAVGELKIRGTSTILRFPLSIKEYLLTTGNIQFTKDNTHITYNAEQSVVATEDPNCCKDSPFDICTHTIKIKNCGAVIDIDETWTQQNWVSPVSSQLMKCLKAKSSVERFNQNSAPNEIINFLKYFSQPNAAHGKVPMSWGSFDMKKFGICMIVVANSLVEVMSNEPRLLDVSSPVYVVGDLHGNFEALMYLEELLWPLSPTLSPSNILFLGDYVDRGVQGLEVVAYLFAYKLHNPNTVYLLRGNHEVRDIQKSFTFYKECLDKFGSQLGVDVWTSINNVFDCMPLAATVDRRIFCCHGGIPPLSLCPTLSSINDIPKVLPLPKNQSELAWNLMWNDPIQMNDLPDPLKHELETQDGFAYNTRRGTGFFFSSEALNVFLKKHNLSHVIRAHEYQHTGASIQFNGKLLTVFSASDYCGERNDSACILLARKKICVFRMGPKSN